MIMSLSPVEKSLIDLNNKMVSSDRRVRILKAVGKWLAENIISIAALAVAIAALLSSSS